MSAKKALFLFFGAILLGFLMIQPFNYICRLTDACFPINLTYYLPKSTTKERYEVFFMAKNYVNSLEFNADQRSKIVNSGGDLSIIYHARNISNKKIKIRPMPYVEPQEMGEYIHFYECLCHREHTIEAGKTLDLIVRLRLKKDIDKNEDLRNKRQIVVGYVIK